MEGLSEGLRYIAGSMPIRTILGLLGIVSMMSAPLTVLMPLLATQVLHGGPYTLGMLTAALGAGALAASLFLAARKSVVGLGRVIAVATAAFGLGLAGLSLSHSLALSLVLMLATGFAMVAEMAASNAVLQTIVEEEKRGRVMSFYTMAFFGMGPLGSLLSGGLAGAIGILPTFLMFGAICLERLAGLCGAAAEPAAGDTADVRSGRHSPRLGSSSQDGRLARQAARLADRNTLPAGCSKAACRRISRSGGFSATLADCRSANNNTAISDRKG